MKIAKIEDLHCDAGWRTFSFLKITTDDGLVGWSEYTEADGSRGLTAVIHGLAEAADRHRPATGPGHRFAAVCASRSRRPTASTSAPSPRSRTPCSTSRARPSASRSTNCSAARCAGASRSTGRIAAPTACATHELVGVPPLHTYDDIAALGAEVKRRGFKALKTNILPFDGEKLVSFGPGFGRTPGWPELNVDRTTLQSRARHAWRRSAQGAGPEMGLHLDVNYHFKTEGYLQVAKAVEPFDLTWLEIDTWDPQSLALIRREAPCPIASLESVHGRRAFRPFFDAYATDVAIIDVIWNGFLESIKIAAMAEAYEVNVAPHNYYGHLCSAISAHFCAVVPNFRVMEIDIDSVSWRDELFINAPVDRERRPHRPRPSRLGRRRQRSGGAGAPAKRNDDDDNATYDILGIGNAIVDVVARADDTFLSRHDMHKGAMILIDAAAADALYAAMPPGQESSGGSAANTCAVAAGAGLPGRLYRQGRRRPAGRACSATTSTPSGCTSPPRRCPAAPPPPAA